MGTDTAGVSLSVSAANFLQSVKKMFDAENINIEEINALFKDPQNDHLIEDQSSELISYLSQYLSKESNDKKVHFFDYCSELIDLVSSKSNPQDALLQLIEEVEQSPDDARLVALLKPLSNVIKMISPMKRVDSLAWSLNSLQTYLHSTIVAEKSDESDCSENNSFDSFPFSYKRLSLYRSLEPFFNSLISESPKNHDGYRKVLVKYLIQLLEKPFTRLDLNHPIAAEVTGNITDMILKVTHSDPFTYLTTSDLYDDQIPSRLGLAVLFCIIYSKDSWIIKTPQIYNPSYIFQNSLQLVTTLLQQYGEPGIEKGLFLVSQLIQRIGASEAPYRLLDSLEHNRFCLELSKVVSYSSFKTTRKDAVDVLNSYINVFEKRGQYLIIYNLISTPVTASLQGFLIDKYRGILAKEIKHGEHMSEYCRGRKLLAVLDLMLSMIIKETDLVQIMDYNIATLNLLRFLILCDQKHNFTGIRDYFPHLEDDYLKRIRVIVQENRAKYSQMIKQLEQGDSKSCSAGVRVNFQLEGLNRGDLNTEEKLATCRSYFTALDFIESLLSRIDECAGLISDGTA